MPAHTYHVTLRQTIEISAEYEADMGHQAEEMAKRDIKEHGTIVETEVVNVTMLDADLLEDV